MTELSPRGAAWLLRKAADEKWNHASRLRHIASETEAVEVAAHLVTTASEMEAEYRAMRAEADALVRPVRRVPTGTEECGKCGGTGKVVHMVDNGTCWDCRGRGWRRA